MPNGCVQFQHDCCRGMSNANDLMIVYWQYLYQILTGRLPFSHRRHDSMVVHDVFHGRRPLRPSNPEVTDQIWELIRSCWHQEPSKRSTMAIVGIWLTLLAEPLSFESKPIWCPRAARLIRWWFTDSYSKTAGLIIPFIPPSHILQCFYTSC